MSVVSLAIDYGNGVHKKFDTIPWQQGLTILGTIEAAQAIPPGLTVDVGSDRAGRAIGVFIDGLPSDPDRSAAWSFWVNGKPGPERLGTETSFGFDKASRAANEVKDGDHILAKLLVVDSTGGETKPPSRGGNQPPTRGGGQSPTRGGSDGPA